MPIKFEKSAKTINIKLSGNIDEDLDFSKYDLFGAEEINFDFKDVKAINSIGCRHWIAWLSKFPNIKMSFEFCPKVIIEQINMVDGFLPRQAQVKSFYVPYFSQTSGAEKNVLFQNGKEFSDGKLNLPNDVKDDDGNPMELDIIPNKYFKFIRR